MTYLLLYELYLIINKLTCHLNQTNLGIHLLPIYRKGFTYFQIELISDVVYRHRSLKFY